MSCEDMGDKMEKDVEEKIEKKVSSWCSGSGDSCGGFGYCLGVIGAAVYYIQSSTGFWAGVVGFLKALVWPAFLVYELLRSLGA